MRSTGIALKSEARRCVCCCGSPAAVEVRPEEAVVAVFAIAVVRAACTKSDPKPSNPKGWVVNH